MTELKVTRRDTAIVLSAVVPKPQGIFTLKRRRKNRTESFFLKDNIVLHQTGFSKDSADPAGPVSKVPH